jgi:hypothetical protein
VLCDLGRASDPPSHNTVCNTHPVALKVGAKRTNFNATVLSYTQAGIFTTELPTKN